MRAVGELLVSVVVATHNRRERLRALLASLGRQTLAPGTFEVIVVDDCSTDGTSEPTDGTSDVCRGRPPVRWLGRSLRGGPAAARNDGWRVARAPLIAFTDDDCEATPEWLAELLAAAEQHPGAVIQGRVGPLPAEASRLRPTTRTIRIHGDGPYYQTCNILYPRELLERLGGFDAESFPVAGEDTDLAWRAKEAGAATVFAPGAQVFHAVNEIGWRGRLRVAWRWRTMLPVYQRHPGARERVFTKRIFWKPWHYALLRALLAPLLPRRLRPLRVWLIAPYVDSLVLRARNEHARPWQVPLLVAEDGVEIAAAAYASVRYRMLVL